MQRVFVLDKNKDPLSPCNPARARILLKKNKAVVFKSYPFTILLKERIGGKKQPLSIKINQCYKKTGLAVVSENKKGNKLIWAGEIHHRPDSISRKLKNRKKLRSFRRSRKVRYRKLKINKYKNNGYSYIKNGKVLFAPSIKSIMDQTVSYTKKICKLTPIKKILIEGVRFNDYRLYSEFNIKELSAVNTARYFLPSKFDSSRAQTCVYEKTQFNMKKQRYRYNHWISAACIDDDGGNVFIPKSLKPLIIKAIGHGNRQTWRGKNMRFSRKKHKYSKKILSFKTGDVVKVKPSKDNKISCYGFVIVRRNGFFDVKIKNRIVNNIYFTHCKVFHKRDGYSYIN